MSNAVLSHILCFQCFGQGYLDNSAYRELADRIERGECSIDDANKELADKARSKWRDAQKEIAASRKFREDEGAWV